MKRAWAVLALIATMVLAGCGGDPTKGGGGGGGGPLAIGSADFAESELLMELYAGALRSTGAQVQTRPRIGSREVLVRALQDGSLAVVPEYSGNLLNYLDKDASATKADEVYAQLRQKLPSGLEVLEKAAAEDKDVLVVTKETAQQRGLSSLEDLGPKCGDLVLGAAGEWRGRWEGRIRQLYGCAFKEIRTTDPAGPVTVEALRSGQVQVANLFTTASAIGVNGFVELADPKQMYPAQNVVPLVRSGAVDDRGRQALNRVSAALTTDKLAAMVRRIEVDKTSVVEVASGFLKENGF
ncbi:osmoprotectant transport system substrate-binding protein [Streptoalloteichus tenebrarius]|uniref:Osmoprotectant transport system substrate-binding protein n=1 Tax=Streptoalloteichus tenebrarius (strain ATCC 17920 / DSM 40477 / JCM 4838 / CBS 697.72 / NBRC 16177 / NCIMB 11028 / NRRL B-12390 / A12253. 1 / ISP 5477) TaxID=1933 RepID=A0ABT1HT71_STRSD|nr:ABC transporter substrate-binding protein [Streptoalloteichus tenebrarius]MCP2258723.1 osmoprotectant transport system substrate-binding protein [Streptoalloteichus tenebrarius]BFF02875.1 ABC transporter substrate-binding protein [Streptoalloteichus tenebrarius]